MSTTPPAAVPGRSGKGRRRRKGSSERDGRPAVAPAPLASPSADRVTSFQELGVPQDLVAVLAAQGIAAPFPIQVATLPDSLAGRDVLGQGRTGSGKTLAFSLPVVARLSAERTGSEPGRPRGLVLVPTRELANQVSEVLSPLARVAGLRVATVFGGVSAQPQLKAFAAGVDILVACPGRLLDHVGSGAVRLDDVVVTVLDEADHMADQGFLPMVRRILDATPADGQRLLFSATLAGGVDMIVERYLHSPVSHKAQEEAPALLDHRVVVVPESERIETLLRLIGDGRAVVFARTKHRAKQLARKIDGLGVRAVDMHGNLSQSARERNLAMFADGRARVLVATDIAARGIHVDDVPLVIHADPPIEHKAYTHRSGRTARAGAAGEVVTIVSPEQQVEIRKLLSRAGVTATWGNGAGEPTLSDPGLGGVRDGMTREQSNTGWGQPRS